MRAIRSSFILTVFAYCIFLIAPKWVEETKAFPLLLASFSAGYFAYLGLKTAGMLGRHIEVRHFIAHIVLSAALMIVASAAIYLSYGFSDTKSGNQAGAALYFSGVTFSTLGFGDITPDVGVARAIAALQAILGNVHLALFAAAVFFFLTEPEQLEGRESRNGGSDHDEHNDNRV